MFGSYISMVHDGPDLVRAAERPGHGQLVSIPSIQLALANLRERYQYILVDSPPSLSEHVLAAVDTADLVWAITGPTRAELTATKELLKLFDRLEVAPGRRLVILDENRLDIPAVDAEEILGRRPDVTIRFSAEIMAAIDSGAPLAQSDPEAESLGTIAELAAGLEDRLLRAVGRNPARGLARKAQASS